MVTNMLTFAIGPKFLAHVDDKSDGEEEPSRNAASSKKHYTERTALLPKSVALQKMMVCPRLILDEFARSDIGGKH
jgi:hypothetical protein